jgi:hypothetical protein
MVNRFTALSGTGRESSGTPVIFQIASAWTTNWPQNQPNKAMVRFLRKSKTYPSEPGSMYFQIARNIAQPVSFQLFVE